MICVLICFFFFKQKPAYEMRISDWSSDVCSSDLRFELVDARGFAEIVPVYGDVDILGKALDEAVRLRKRGAALEEQPWLVGAALMIELVQRPARSEERSVGKECVSTCRSRGSRSHKKKKNYRLISVVRTK